MATNDNSNSNPAVTDAQALATPESVTPPPTTVPSGKARVAVGAFNRVTDAVLIALAQGILTAMTGNPAYPAPTPTLADIAAALNAFKAAEIAARDSRRMVVVRRQRRAALVAALGKLALYVQLACDGDLPTLMSSGFTARRTHQPIGPLPAPLDLRLARGRNSGQLIARCRRLPRAGAYEWRYASAATPTTWVEVDSTFAASVVIEGLVPGTEYIVQARAIGTNGPSDWCDAAAMIVV